MNEESTNPVNMPFMVTVQYEPGIPFMVETRHGALLTGAVTGSTRGKPNEVDLYYVGSDVAPPTRYWYVALQPGMPVPAEAWLIRPPVLLWRWSASSVDEPTYLTLFGMSEEGAVAFHRQRMERIGAELKAELKARRAATAPDMRRDVILKHVDNDLCRMLNASLNDRERIRDECVEYLRGVLDVLIPE